LRSPWGAEGGKFPVKGGENLAEIGHAPPVSNRGVQNTSRSALRACVDWVQVTFESVHDLQAIYEILGMREGDFEDCPTGIYGYKFQRRAGHISILRMDDDIPVPEFGNCKPGRQVAGAIGRGPEGEGPDCAGDLLSKLLADVLQAHVRNAGGIEGATGRIAKLLNELKNL